MMEATMLVERASAVTFAPSVTSVTRIGMPEMCRTGLSENWLWKVCGHQHWLALAQAYGLSRPDFRDAEDGRLYPAFIAVDLADGRMDAVAENDLLSITARLERLGPSRFCSRVSVSTTDGLNVALLRMETAFVRRAVSGRNRSATRGLVAQSCRIPAPAVGAEPPFRPKSWERHGPFVRSERQVVASHIIDPVPQEDFNGADFLYFASFQAMLDRAEWAWRRRCEPLLTTRARKLVYLGNVELGDRVIATLCGDVGAPNGISQWVELARESDGALIALAFNDRRASRRAALD